MPESAALGKWLVVIGLGVAALGGLIWLVGRLGLPLGRLPGDFSYQRGGLTVYLPCATSLLVSLALTLGLGLLARLLNR